MTIQNSRNSHRRPAFRGPFLASVGLLAFCLSSCGPGRGTIGAMLARQASGKLVVHAAPPGLGSERAGLRPGDEILLIDGIDVRSLTPAQLHHVLSGAPGQKVRLTVIRGDEILRVTVRRTAARSHRAGEALDGSASVDE